MTIGTFSTTNQNSTIASLGTQRADWGEGFNRPMTTYVHRADADEDCGATIRCAPGTTCGISSWDDHEHRVIRRAASTSTASTRAQQLGAATERSRAVVGAVPAGPADVGDRRASRRRARRRASSRSRRPASSRQTSQALFLQDDWRVSPRLTLNLGVRVEINGGMSEVDQSQSGRLRHDERQPDRGRGQGRVRAQSDSADSRRRVRRQGRPAVCRRSGQRDQDQDPAARGGCRTC